MAVFIDFNAMDVIFGMLYISRMGYDGFFMAIVGLVWVR